MMRSRPWQRIGPVSHKRRRHMRKLRLVFFAVFLACIGSVALGRFGQAQRQDFHPSTLFGVVPPAPAVYKLEDAFLQWPLPPRDQAYGAIDGRHLHGYVVDQAAIARRYRDRGHPQFWGRITGTSGDAESAQWLAERFKAGGLSDVRVQPIDLPPQWMPDSWTITATSGDRSLQLDRSAQPAYLSPGTAAAGLDLEAVWAGTGSEADFAGRDVPGKAVFMISAPLPGSMHQ